MRNVRLQNALQKASTVAALNQALEDYLHEFGIKTFAFTYYSYHPNSQNKIKYDYCSKNFELWHNHFRSEGYDDVDSTLDIVYQTTLPTFWDLQQQLKAAKTPREKQMRLDSIAYGAEKGLSIPIHGPAEDFAILLLVQMRGETCLAEWENIQQELFSAAYYYYYYLQRRLLLTHEPSDKYQLNKRDMQCLTLIAKQYSIDAIANTLHITPRTVNYHIQRLNKKFGTQNKYQTVMKGLQKGIITL